MCIKIVIQFVKNALIFLLIILFRSKSWWFEFKGKNSCENKLIFNQHYKQFIVYFCFLLKNFLFRINKNNLDSSESSSPEILLLDIADFRVQFLIYIVTFHCR